MKTDTNSSIVSRFGYLNYMSKLYRSVQPKFKIIPKVETNSQYSSEHFDTILRAKLTRYEPEWIEDFNTYRRMKKDMVSIVWRQKLNSQPLNVMKQILFEPKQTHFSDINLDFVSNHNYSSDMISNKGSGELHIKEIQHLGRIVGNISSTPTKLMEIILTFKLHGLNIKSISSIAEGSGGILFLLGCIYPSAKLNYNTLISPTIDMRISPDMNYPPTFQNTKLNHKDRSFGLDITALGITDILQSSFRTKYKNMLINHSVDVLTIDAEAPTIEHNNTIFLSLYTPIFENYFTGNGYFIIELYLFPEIFNQVDKIMEENKIPLNRWTMFKPVTSHPNNREVYLIILGEKISKKHSSY